MQRRSGDPAAGCIVNGCGLDADGNAFSIFLCTFEKCIESVSATIGGQDIGSLKFSSGRKKIYSIYPACSAPLTAPGSRSHSFA